MAAQSPIKPFNIQVPESAISIIKSKLADATFPDEVDFSNDWKYGAPLAEVKRLAKYWQNTFDWRAQEEKLNKLPQFTTTVDVKDFGDLELHFIHQKSSNSNSIPLLFCHGWPGSFLEVLKILEPLTNNPSGPSFHIVAPSLPNFAFSQGVSKPGFGIPHYAEALHNLMQKLGYTKYALQGGDWGFIITRMLSLHYSTHILFSHLNHVNANPPDAAKHPLLWLQHQLTPYTSREKKGLERTEWFTTDGFGYNRLHRTKPATIGFALRDSPVALLAWLLEKLHDWTDEYPWGDDELLTWVCVYAFSRAGPEASVRIYYECFRVQKNEVDRCFEYNADVPLGLASLPRDIVVVPRLWGRTLGPAVVESMREDGGHFATHEKPEYIIEDLREMVRRCGL